MKRAVALILTALLTSMIGDALRAWSMRQMRDNDYRRVVNKPRAWHAAASRRAAQENAKP